MESSKNRSRAVTEIMKAFKELSKDTSPFDKPFDSIKDLYKELQEKERGVLFGAIIEQMEIRKSDIEGTLEALLGCEQDDPAWHGLLPELRNKLHSPRLTVFRKISRSPGGLKFLLDFRGDLLSARRHLSLDLGPLDSDITFLLEMWFQEGFLYLEEITLNSSYRQIELIKDRDMVHPMAGIEEMGQRLGIDRRCFALYHRLLPYEPIIFIEVALTEGLARNMSEVMARAGDESGDLRVDTAIFYSINNTQIGLAGLGLGKMLIGKVVDYVREEDERIKNFATLSPLPRFWNGYLRPLLEGTGEEFDLKPSDILPLFSKRAAVRIVERSGGGEVSADRFNEALLSTLADEAWPRDEELIKILRVPMIKIAYHYIAREKTPQQKPLNAVAGFHLGNGAVVSERNVNFLANPSSKGIEESCGIMVNYLYSFNWLGQVRRSLRWFDGMEIKGLFSRRP